VRERELFDVNKSPSAMMVFGSAKEVVMFFLTDEQKNKK
jgi:hypothetical protein